MLGVEHCGTMRVMTEDSPGSVRSQGHLWFPLEVPLNSNREAMTEALVVQVQRIVAVAYPAASAEPHLTP